METANENNNFKKLYFSSFMVKKKMKSFSSFSLILKFKINRIELFSHVLFLTILQFFSKINLYKKMTI